MKSPERQWYEFDDSQVTTVDSAYIVSNVQAYILFYAKCDDYVLNVQQRLAALNFEQVGDDFLAKTISLQQPPVLRRSTRAAASSQPLFTLERPLLTCVVYNSKNYSSAITSAASGCGDSARSPTPVRSPTTTSSAPTATSHRSTPPTLTRSTTVSRPINGRCSMKCAAWIKSKKILVMAAARSALSSWRTAHCARRCGVECS